MKNNILIAIVILFIQTRLSSQETDFGQISGNFQLNMQTYSTDTLIGANEVADKVRLNAYSNIIYTRGKFTAGVRFESYLNPIVGYDEQSNGTGLAHRYLTYNDEKFEITVGNFYEQFGSGLILRTYEDKALDYDNALNGIKLKYIVAKSLYVKAIWGQQRSHFAKDKNGISQTIYGNGIVRGFDAEFFINELFENSELPAISLGGSFVSKFQDNDLNNPFYYLPANVGAFAGRINLAHKGFSILGEYAQKINDPSAENGFIFKKGEALLINASYSQKGLGVFVSAKRVDNMSFRSERSALLNRLSINSLPAISKNHTYSFAAMYPFATQANGEIGFQAEIMYEFQKGSALGGEYGTNVSLNFSQINSIEMQQVNDTAGVNEAGTLGYKSAFFKLGDELLFRDINFELNKKLTKWFKFTAIYQNILYNQNVLRGKFDKPDVKAHVGILDMTFKLASKHALRFEFQSLITEKTMDMGSWAMAAVEYTFSPHYFFSVQNQYNYGNYEAKKRVHYYYASTGYNYKTHRFQFGYGKQREGVMCVGGVCRYVPAAYGFTFSITSTF